MTILAFLQNQWFHNPAKVERLMQVYPDQRESMIHFALFRGCLTGRRLEAAFGEELCNQIIWENASPKIAGQSDGVFPADTAHMADAIGKHNPQIILSFGSVAAAGLDQIPNYTALRIIIRGPHPAARFPYIRSQLLTMAAEVRSAMNIIREATLCAQ